MNKQREIEKLIERNRKLYGGVSRTKQRWIQEGKLGPFQVVERKA